MSGRFKELLREMFNPPLEPMKKRLFAVLFGGVPAALVILLIYGMPLLPSVIIAAALTAVLALSFVFEVRSKKKGAALSEAVKSGEYYADEGWREKYRRYCEKHDFEPVTAASMRGDLSRRYLKVSGIVMAAFSLAFFIPAVIWDSPSAEANVFLAIGGALFLGWGIAKLLRTPVRGFIRDCGNELAHIERSYLSGRMLTYRRSGIDWVNNGINIGGNYTVVYYKSAIRAIENRSITGVSRSIKRTDHYVNGIYTGSYSFFFLRIDYTDSSGSSRCIRIELNEFQAEMAYDALSANHAAPGYQSVTEHEIG